MAAIAREQVGFPKEGRRPGWMLGALAAVALAAVAMAAVAVLSQTPAGTREGAAPGRQGYTEDELEVFRLVEAGVLPADVLHAEPFRTKQLVAQGTIPYETLLPGREYVAPLWCPQERAVMRAVAAGLVPADALDAEPFRTKRLIAQGLIPRETAEPCW